MEEQSKLKESDHRSKYNRLKVMLSHFKGEKYHIEAFKQLIRLKIGSSPKTVEDTMKLMIETNLIHEVEHLIFKIT